MLTLEQHFSAGYLPAALGSYFNVALLLASTSAGAPSELSTAIAARIPELRQSGERVKESVRHVEALAALAGVVVPVPPRVPEEYFSWFTAVHEGFRAELRVNDPNEVVWAFGHRVGEIFCTEAVAAMVLVLLQAAPESAFLQRQRDACAADLLGTVRALLVTTQHPALPQALYALGELLHSSVSAGAERLLQGTETPGGLDEQLREMRVAVQHATNALRASGGAAEA